ncbi:MAG TPA: hypothetical protein VF286_00960 [Acidiphilium sp.]
MKITIDDVIALQDTTLPAKAREAFQAAHANVEAVQRDIAAAEASLTVARDARAALVARAGAGETIARADLLKAEKAITDAETAIAFQRDIAVAAEASKAQAEQDMVTAQGRSWRPVLAAAMALRIKGAEAVEEAKREVQQAGRIYALGVEAVQRCQRAGHSIQFPFSPAQTQNDSRLIVEMLRPREAPHPAPERKLWIHYLDESGNLILPDAVRELMERAI